MALQFDKIRGGFDWQRTSASRPPRKPMSVKRKLLLTMGILMGLGAIFGRQSVERQVEAYNHRPLITTTDQAQAEELVASQPDRPHFRVDHKSLGNGIWQVDIISAGGDFSGAKVSFGPRAGCGAVMVGRKGEKIGKGKMRFTIDTRGILPGGSCTCRARVSSVAIDILDMFSNRSGH